MKIAFFGNCQSHIISRYIDNICKNCDVIYMSNNSRTGDFKSEDEIYEQAENADVVVCQHLDDAHGRLSTRSMKSHLSDKNFITMPYVFNSGVTIVGYAPMSPKYSYGEIFGQEEILTILDRRETAASVIAEIEQGNDLGSMDRFNQSIDQLKLREENLDVNISDLICELYQDELLMITHNHPTNIIFTHMMQQIIDILNLQYDRHALAALRNQDNNATYTGAPYVPQDIHRLGIKFGYHTDWKEKISHLVGILIRSRHGEHVPPSVFEGVRFPSVATV